MLVTKILAPSYTRVKTVIVAQSKIQGLAGKIPIFYYFESIAMSLKTRLVLFFGPQI